MVHFCIKFQLVSEFMLVVWQMLLQISLILNVVLFPFGIEFLELETASWYPLNYWKLGQLTGKYGEKCKTFIL